jgi:hypothetical protein
MAHVVMGRMAHVAMGLHVAARYSWEMWERCRSGCSCKKASQRRRDDTRHATRRRQRAQSRQRTARARAPAANVDPAKLPACRHIRTWPLRRGWVGRWGAPRCRSSHSFIEFFLYTYHYTIVVSINTLSATPAAARQPQPQAGGPVQQRQRARAWQRWRLRGVRSCALLLALALALSFPRSP